MARYLLVSNKPWGKIALNELRKWVPEHEWQLIQDQEKEGSPARCYSAAFFLHYGKLVPDYFLSQTPCFGFHLAPLPFGRGGTPLQNMILSGVASTPISMFKMEPGAAFDSGPLMVGMSGIEVSEDISLTGRAAEDIYRQAMYEATAKIASYVKGYLQPKEQEGEVVSFTRLTTKHNEIPSNNVTLDTIFDYIRMTDAETYPKAWLKIGKIKIEFSRAALRLGRVDCDAKITIENE